MTTIVLLIILNANGGVAQIHMPDMKVCLEGAAKINNSYNRPAAHCLEASK